MAVSVLYVSMSLDGYIADPNDHLGGDDGNRLHQCALTPDGGALPAVRAGRSIGRRNERDRRGPRGTADYRDRRSLGR